MATLEMNNSITSMIRDLEKAAEQIPELRKQILNAQAEIVKPALRSAVTSAGLIDTGMLRESIEASPKKRETEIHVGPTGVHHRYLRISGSGEVRSGHVGYIHEYGIPSRGIRPKKWMSKAVAQVADDALKAAESTHDEFMKKYNL